jgi:hypothetical protein
MSQKNTIGLAILIALLGGVLWRTVLNAPPPPRDVRSVEVLTETASAASRKLPVQVDAETELFHVAALPGVLVYNYRLVKQKASDLDAAKVAEMLHPLVLQSACSTPETRDQLLAAGVVLRYIYLDRDKAPVTSFDIAPGDCK